MGPLPNADDSGSEMMSALASILSVSDENKDSDYSSIFDGINDTIGSFYTFTLPKSLLGRRRVD